MSRRKNDEQRKKDREIQRRLREAESGKRKAEQRIVSLGLVDQLEAELRETELRIERYRSGVIELMRLLKDMPPTRPIDPSIPKLPLRPTLSLYCRTLDTCVLEKRCDHCFERLFVLSRHRMCSRCAERTVKMESECREYEKARDHVWSVLGELGEYWKPFYNRASGSCFSHSTCLELIQMSSHDIFKIEHVYGGVLGDIMTKWAHTHVEKVKEEEVMREAEEEARRNWVPPQPPPPPTYRVGMFGP